MVQELVSDLDLPIQQDAEDDPVKTEIDSIIVSQLFLFDPEEHQSKIPNSRLIIRIITLSNIPEFGPSSTKM